MLQYKSKAKERETDMNKKTLTKLLQELKGADETLYFEQVGTDTDYFYIRKEGIPYNIGSARGNEMAHFLKAFKRTGLKATEHNIETAHRVFDMAISLRAYGRTTLKSIIESEYINGKLYELSPIAKRTLVTYLLNVVDETGYAGDDSEGNSYNYLKLIEAV